MAAVTQIHVATHLGVQTLAAVQTADGVTLCSSFAARSHLDDGELHIPAAARAWLADVVAQMAPPSEVV